MEVKPPRSLVREYGHWSENMVIGPKIWPLVPKSLKEATSVIELKGKIKQWKPEKCPLVEYEKHLYQV